jgi:hypothetical protein
MTETTTTPLFASISRWCHLSGMGRTRTYEEAGAGNLRIIKVGGRSLVDVPHGLAWMRSLPTARIRPPTGSDRNGEPQAGAFRSREAAHG